jgi:hypothetical protein
VDEAILEMQSYYKDSLDWYKKFPKSIRWEMGEGIVLSDYVKQHLDLSNAHGLPLNKKLFVLDNAINQVHVDYNALSHMRMDIENKVYKEYEGKKSEEWITKEVKRQEELFEEFFDFFEQVLKKQGKELRTSLTDETQKKVVNENLYAIDEKGNEVYENPESDEIGEEMKGLMDRDGNIYVWNYHDESTFHRNMLRVFDTTMGEIERNFDYMPIDVYKPISGGKYQCVFAEDWSRELYKHTADNGVDELLQRVDRSRRRNPRINFDKLETTIMKYSDEKAVNESTENSE